MQPADVIVVLRTPTGGCPEFAQLPSDVKAAFEAEGRRRAQELIARIRAGNKGDKNARSSAVVASNLFSP
jgi:hypothetical protein